jgi:hypothetical protein
MSPMFQELGKGWSSGLLRNSNPWIANGTVQELCTGLVVSETKGEKLWIKLGTQSRIETHTQRPNTGRTRALDGKRLLSGSW